MVILVGIKIFYSILFYTATKSETALYTQPEEEVPERFLLCEWDGGQTSASGAVLRQRYGVGTGTDLRRKKISANRLRSWDRLGRE